MSAPPPISDISLFRYCESIVDLNAWQVSTWGRLSPTLLARAGEVIE